MINELLCYDLIDFGIENYNEILLSIQIFEYVIEDMYDFNNCNEKKIVTLKQLTLR